MVVSPNFDSVFWLAGQPTEDMSEERDRQSRRSMARRGHAQRVSTGELIEERVRKDEIQLLSGTHVLYRGLSPRQFLKLIQA